VNRRITKISERLKGKLERVWLKKEERRFIYG
jgi:hypothetical protein